jgi:delta-aminolevulinic acid dehydratase/porphobilinogen synthase
MSSLSSLSHDYIITPKFTTTERLQIQSIVAVVSIKRIPDPKIVKEIHRQSHKTINRITVFNIRKRIKQDSYRWYQKLREGEYE